MQQQQAAAKRVHQQQASDQDNEEARQLRLALGKHQNELQDAQRQLAEAQADLCSAQAHAGSKDAALAAGAEQLKQLDQELESRHEALQVGQRTACAGMHVVLQHCSHSMHVVLQHCSHKNVNRR